MAVSQTDCPPKTRSQTNRHNFGFVTLHTRLKGFGRPPLHTRESQDPIADQDTIDSLPCVPKTILNLPVELILSVCDHLTADDHACLVLTCHQLYYYIGNRIFNTLDNTRFELAAFLQRLQKDRPSRDLWLCYGCLHFDSTAHRYNPPNFRALSRKEMPGFPYCQSTYAKAIDEIYSRLHTLWTGESKQMHWMEDDITSPVHMSAYISSLGNATDLMLRCRYRINCTRKYAGMQSSIAEDRLLQTLAASNLGICPHIVFARDRQRGDGSIMSLLQEQEEAYHVVQDSCHMFECKECLLEVELKIRRVNSEVVVTAWQYVGNLPAQKDSKEAHLVPNSLPLSAPLLSPRVKKFVLPKLLSSQFDRLKRRESGTAASQAEVAAVLPLRPVVLLLGQGELRRRWESLEVEARESSVGVRYTALTVLGDVDNETVDRCGHLYL